MDDSSPQPKPNTRVQRVVTGTIFSLVAVLFIYLSPLTLRLFALALSAMTYYELHVILKATPLEQLVGAALLVTQQLIGLYDVTLTFELFPVVAFFAYALLALATHDMVKAMQLFFSTFWAVHLLFYCVGITLQTNTTLTCLYVVFLTCCNDGFQYLFGRLFGKHRPLSYLSPNKSVEGYIGGLLVLLLLGLLAQESAVFSVMIFAAGVAGDLAASCLKRQLNTKDFGSVLPGMGGMLDRLDSILFTITFAYYWYRFAGFEPGLVLRCILRVFYATDHQCL